MYCCVVKLALTDVSEVCTASTIRAMMMEAVRTSETSVNIYLTARQYIPEDSKLHTSCSENLKSHMGTCYLNSLTLTKDEDLTSKNKNLHAATIKASNPKHLNTTLESDLKLTKLLGGMSVSAYYDGIKIFNSLLSSLTSLRNKKEQFKVALKRHLITHSFYYVDKFLMFASNS
jgi:hypothetical protein